MFLASSLFGQWPTSPDSQINVGAIGTGYGAVPDGHGGAFITYGYVELLSARLDSTGQFAWSNLHLDYNGDEASLNGYAISTDGCFLLSYHDLEWVGDEAEADIIVQKIDLNGNKLWGFGITVSPPNVSGTIPGGYWLQSLIIGSPSGEAYVAWTDLRSGGYIGQLYVQKLSSSGELLWDEYGVMVADSVESIKHLTMLSDTTFAVIFNTADLSWNRSQYIQSFSSSGIALWDSLGVEIPTIPGTYYETDDLGNLFFRHEGDRIAKMNMNVLPTAELDDYLIETPHTTFVKALCPDNNGGVFLTVNDDGPTADRGYCQWISGEGTSLFGESGIHVWSDQFYFSASIVRSAGAMITINAGSGQDCYKLDSTGIFAWDSVHLSDITTPMYPWPSAVSDGFGGAIYLFTENYSLYATKVNSDGTMGGTSEIELCEKLPRNLTLAVFPNPANPSTRINYELPYHSDVTVTVYDLRGRQVWIHQVPEETAGKHTLRWDGVSFSGRRVDSGIYIIQLSTGNWHESRKLAVVK